MRGQPRGELELQPRGGWWWATAHKAGALQGRDALSEVGHTGSLRAEAWCNHATNDIKFDELRTAHVPCFQKVRWDFCRRLVPKGLNYDDLLVNKKLPVNFIVRF